MSHLRKMAELILRILFLPLYSMGGCGEKLSVFIYVIDFWPRLLMGLLLVLQGFNYKRLNVELMFAMMPVQQEDSEQSGALAEQHCQNFSRIHSL